MSRFRIPHGEGHDDLPCLLRARIRSREPEVEVRERSCDKLQGQRGVGDPQGCRWAAPDGIGESIRVGDPVHHGLQPPPEVPLPRRAGRLDVLLHGFDGGQFLRPAHQLSKVPCLELCDGRDGADVGAGEAHEDHVRPVVRDEHVLVHLRHAPAPQQVLVEVREHATGRTAVPCAQQHAVDVFEYCPVFKGHRRPVELLDPWAEGQVPANEVRDEVVRLRGELAEGPLPRLPQQLEPLGTALRHGAADVVEQGAQVRGPVVEGLREAVPQPVAVVVVVHVRQGVHPRDDEGPVTRTLSTASEATAATSADTSADVSPNPTTSTRFPRKTSALTYCDEWTTSPLNVSCPGKVGMLGWPFGPVHTATWSKPAKVCIATSSFLSP
eukprot:Sspe_Gene.8034::Locus_2732_Transcript_1_1_Confidence_1.000_Length_2139::g.8034::m.8034